MPTHKDVVASLVTILSAAETDKQAFCDEVKEVLVADVQIAQAGLAKVAGGMLDGTEWTA